MSNGWRVVYQGGLHDKWCNGTSHIKGPGGQAQIEASWDAGSVQGRADASKFPLDACDCAAWRTKREAQSKYVAVHRPGCRCA